MYIALKPASDDTILFKTNFVGKAITTSIWECFRRNRFAWYDNRNRKEIGNSSYFTTLGKSVLNASLFLVGISRLDFEYYMMTEIGY